MDKIQIYKPYIPAVCSEYVVDAIKSGWISSSGKYVDLVQEVLCKKNKVKHVLLCNTGTAACHLMAKAVVNKFGGHFPGCLMVPNNVFVAAWNAWIYDLKPNFIPMDADIDTWNINLKNKLSNDWHDEVVLLCVHNVGNIINIPKIKREYPKLHIIEDNCEGFLGKYEGEPTGSQSFASAISFFGNKTITCGEGGAFLTNDDEAYKHAKHLWGQGMTEKRYVHDELGYNYRLTNLQAAFLFGQLEFLPDIMDKKQKLFDYYRAELPSEFVKTQKTEDGTQHSNWMMGVRVLGNSSYENVNSFMTDRGIEIRPMFYPMSTHKHLKKYSDTSKETVATLLSKECFMIPSHPEVTMEQREFVVKAVKEYSNKLHT